MHTNSFHASGSLDKAEVTKVTMMQNLLPFSLHAQTINVTKTLCIFWAAWYNKVVVAARNHISIECGNGMQMYFSAIPHKVQQTCQNCTPILSDGTVTLMMMCMWTFQFLWGLYVNTKTSSIWDTGTEINDIHFTMPVELVTASVHFSCLSLSHS